MSGLILDPPLCSSRFRSQTNAHGGERILVYGLGALWWKPGSHCVTDSTIWSSSFGQPFCHQPTKKWSAPSSLAAMATPASDDGNTCATHHTYRGQDLGRIRLHQPGPNEMTPAIYEMSKFEVPPSSSSSSSFPSPSSSSPCLFTACSLCNERCACRSPFPSGGMCL